MTPIDRRTLIAVAGTSALTIAHNTAKAAPSERTTVCVVGVRGAGWA